MVDADVAARFGAVPHWAKVELPQHPGMCLPHFRDQACVCLSTFP